MTAVRRALLALLLLALAGRLWAIPILPPAVEDDSVEDGPAVEDRSEERFEDEIDRRFDVPESALRDVTFAAAELARAGKAVGPAGVVDAPRFAAVTADNATDATNATAPAANSTAPAAPASNSTAAASNSTTTSSSNTTTTTTSSSTTTTDAPAPAPAPAPRPAGTNDLCWRWLKPLSTGALTQDRRRDLASWADAAGNVLLYSGVGDGGAGLQHAASAVAELEVFTPAKGSWSTRTIGVSDTTDPKPMTSTHAAFASDPATGTLYEFGGLRSTTASNVVQVTNLLAQVAVADGAYTWSRIKATNGPDDGSVPPAMSESSMVFFGGLLVVFGGQTETARTNMLYVIRPGEWKWSKPLLNGRSPSARSGAAMVATGDAIYLYGGHDDEKFFGDVYKLKPSMGGKDMLLGAWEWTQITPGNGAFAPQPAARAYVNAVLLPGNQIMFQGGANPPASGYYADVAVLDLSAEDGSANWLTLPASLGQSYEPQHRQRGSAVAMGSTVYFFGGCGGHECYDIFSPQSIDLNGVCRNTCQHGSFDALADGTAVCDCHDDWGGKFCAEKSQCVRDCTSPLHGKCLTDATGHASCHCQAGFSGSDCSKVSCFDNCNSATGHGACAGSHCVCRRTWFGLGCENMKCGLENCNGHGICTPQLGTPKSVCKCLPHFFGPHCEYYGVPPVARPAAPVAPAAASNTTTTAAAAASTNTTTTTNTTAAASFLELEVGVTADNVTASVQNTSTTSTVDPNTIGTEVMYGGLQKYVADYSCPDNCGGNGYCEREVDADGNVRGVCKCVAGFAGVDCGGECTLHCTSPLRGKCVGDSALPTCECAVGYRGEGCEESFCDRNCSGTAHGTCEGDACVCTYPWTGAACQLDGSCSGHGTFKDGSYCECEPGYGGFDCSVQVTCVGGCGDNGMCVGSVVLEANKDQPVVGSCRCLSGWRGSQCDQKACPKNCDGHGRCAADGTCSCYSSYAGMACDRLVVCPNNCTGTHGHCIPDPTNPESVTGVCQCEDRWSGDACQNLGCPNACGHRGKCIEGQCLCDAGYSGAACEVACPRKCADEKGIPRGICVESQCMCYPGWNGTDCSLPAQCPNDCSGHGECFQPQAKCFCQPGFEGTDCSVVSQCGASGCSAHGTCANGKCFCDPGFEGQHCERKAACESDCNLRGLCVNGKCFCNTGFAGDTCANVAQDPNCPKNCSGNGVCQYGRCFCVAGYSGESCEVPTLDEQCRRSATSAGLCEGRGMCRFGKCFCPPGFDGQFCEKEEVCPGGCMKDQGVCLLGECRCLPGFKGPDCSEDDVCEGTPMPCSGHGLCIQGGCACFPGYSGSACETVEIKNIESSCPNNCTDGGVCHLGRCFCIEGRDGKDCSVKTQDACPDACNNHGLCRFGQCFCKPGYMGRSCGEKLECSADCLKNGVCAYGHCFCVPGYTGKNCDRPVDLDERRRVLEADIADAVKLSQSLAPANSTTYCYGGCGGHGTCIANRCFCGPGYSGTNCQDVEGGPLAHRCANNCNGNGQCLFGQCYCDGGWTGTFCNQTVVLSCKSNCNGRGTCYNGKCNCDLGYEGAACEQSSSCPEECEANQRGVCCQGRCACVRGFFGVTCNQTNVYSATKASFRELREDAMDRAAAMSLASEGGASASQPGSVGAGAGSQDSCGGQCSEVNGVCVNSQCYCRPGWTGADCNTAEKTPEAIRSLSADAGLLLGPEQPANGVGQARSPTSYLMLSVLSFSAGIVVCLLGQVAWAKHKDMRRKRATKDIFKPLLHTMDQQ